MTLYYFITLVVGNMGYNVEIAVPHSEVEWNEYNKSSSHGTIFHTWEWLKIMEKHSKSTLYPLKILKGSFHIANYPIFFNEKAKFRFALSPAPNSNSLYLGPVIANYDSFLQKKKEDYLIGIQSAVDRFLFSDLKCNYVRLRSSPGLDDSRFFLWAGYHVEPNYTYRLDLTKSPDSLWENLHKTIRTSINSARKKGISVTKGDKTDLLFIESQIGKRFEAQDLKKNDHSAFLCDIFDEFNGHNLEVNVAKENGKTISGIIHLFYNGIVYQWMGVPKPAIAGISPNELLVWETILSAQKNGYNMYEFMDGGIDSRLRVFKSKFNPETCIWYSAEKYSHPVYGMAKQMYQKLGSPVKL